MATEDDNNQLLKEILALLKSNQQELTDAKKMDHRTFVMKGIFNAAILIFVGFATYFYYHTLVTSLGG